MSSDPIRITDNLFYGAASQCPPSNPDMAVIHACKDPCHRRAVGYAGKIDPTHPHYLALEKDHHLYLNLIDPGVPLFKMESFDRFFDFVDRHLGRRPLFIHCNLGQSRAPSLALLLCAKRLNLITDTSYSDAKSDFTRQWPYTPSAGIQQFLAENWAWFGKQD